MRIYIAGKYTAQARLRTERERLQALGYLVDCTWMDQPEQGYAVTPERAISEAFRDIEEIRAVDAMIIATLDDRNTGGRDDALGCAIAWGHKIVLIGPERNIFHSLAARQFDSWADFFEEAGAPAPEAPTVA